MNNQIWGDNETEYFFNLNPETILNSIDKLGFKTTGRTLALNSMENRVYELEIESPDGSLANDFIVAKFYRPGRWSKEQILEEHQFLKELIEDDIPAIGPMKIDGQTLFEIETHKLWFTIFPKKAGRIPDELNDEKIGILGRLLARIHNTGVRTQATHRLEINPTTFGRNNLELLLNNQNLPKKYHTPLSDIVNRLCDTIDPWFDGILNHRIHGDCHRSNLIYREDEGLFFVDFDDMLIGPAVQDVWLLVPGDDKFALEDREKLLANYEIMRDFDYNTLRLIEPLRALRYTHFAAWMAKRWDDPSFKTAFPYFGSDEYWSSLIGDLYHQLEKIQGISYF